MTHWRSLAAMVEYPVTRNETAFVAQVMMDGAWQDIPDGSRKTNFAARERAVDWLENEGKGRPWRVRVISRHIVERAQDELQRNGER